MCRLTIVHYYVCSAHSVNTVYTSSEVCVCRSHACSVAFHVKRANWWLVALGIGKECTASSPDVVMN